MNILWRFCHRLPQIIPIFSLIGIVCNLPSLERGNCSHHNMWLVQHKCLVVPCNNPKDFIFWSWPCSPQIRYAMDQLSFVFLVHKSNNIVFILCDIFDPIPGGKVAIQTLLRIIEVLIPIIIWRKFRQMLLPAPGWHILKLKIEVAFFDPGLAVSHWIDSVCRRCV